MPALPGPAMMAAVPSTVSLSPSTLASERSAPSPTVSRLLP